MVWTWFGWFSSQSDVHEFLSQMNLNPEHYQVGHQKIFLRESEKAKLDYRLHQAILASIVTIQRWFRSCIERRNFLSIRGAVVRIQVPFKSWCYQVKSFGWLFLCFLFQSYVRMFLAQRQTMNLRVRHMAATFIQKVWRGYQVGTVFTSTLKEYQIMFNQSNNQKKIIIIFHKLNNQIIINNV